MIDSQSEKITYDVYNLKGKKISHNSLVIPVTKLENQLKVLTQAIRVYLSNQRQGTVSTKTRGEVEGSTRKIYRQKGTGRARHGDIKAPIFIGGGIIFGPKPRNFNLHLPEKMSKKAFLLTIFDKLKNNQLIIVTKLAGLSPKTSSFYNLLKDLFKEEIRKFKFLFINDDNKNAYLAARNIKNVTVVPVNTVNTLEVLSHQKIIIDETNFNKLVSRIGIKIPKKTESKRIQRKKV